MRRQYWLKWGGLVFLCLIAFLFGLKKINLTNADIGRHLVNGRLLVEQRTLVSTNYYSYTMPDKLVINHHWLSGVVFHWLYQLAGFSSLTIFFATLLTISLVFFLLIGRLKASWWSLVFTTVILLPLVGLRTEVRPEVFSLVFLGFELWFLLRIMKKKQFRWWVLVVFGLIQALWVNLHLFFFLSWVVVGAMLIQQLINKEKQASWFLAKLLGVLVVTSFINPFTYQGVIEPFLIMQDFGYQLAENQTLFFMVKRFGTLKYYHGLLASILALVSGGYWLWRYQAQRLFVSILLITFGSFALVMNRFVPVLGLVFIGFGSWVLTELLNNKKEVEKSLVPFLSVFLLLVFISSRSYLSPFSSNFGLGLMPGVKNSAEFFQQHSLSGPVFNNYDVGGYLIKELFPAQRVFVDNRPEAYSPEFFTKYIAAQEDQQAWQQLDQEHGFETIFFYRHDFTPWAQPFLIKRVKDEAWVPIYVDDYALILVKNNQHNQELVEKFSLPLEIFNF